MLLDDAISREDDASTQTADDSMAALKTSSIDHLALNGSSNRRPPLAPRRRVRIVEAKNTYHVREFTEHDDVDLWYSAQDFVTFHQKAQDMANKLQATKDPQAWANKLLRVYFTFRLTDAAAQVPATNDLNICFVETNFGLQDRFLTAISSDFLLRRRHLLHEVFRLQQSLRHDPVARDALIQETSRLSSHAARMYASFVAQVLAHDR